MGGREVLARVHHARHATEHLDVGLDAGLLIVMEDRHLRQMPDLPAGQLDATAEVGLVGVHEVALVEIP